MFLGLLASACAHAGDGSPREDCVLAPSDSVFLRTGPVFRDCAVDKRARLLEPSVRIDYRPNVTPRPGSTDCYHAEVLLVVNPDGSPEVGTARLERTNEAGFGQAVLASIPNWRYEPAEKSGQSVRQIVRERRVFAVAVTVSRVGQTARPPPPPPCR